MCFQSQAVGVVAAQIDGPGGFPEAEKHAVPGVITVLDGGVPWIRDRFELDTEWTALDNAATRYLVREGVCVYGRLDVGERALLGMWTTARWTLGKDVVSPITRDESAVCGASIRRELSKAHAGMAERGNGWEYATGVAFWLLWITGATDDLEWPGWDVTHPPRQC